MVKKGRKPITRLRSRYVVQVPPSIGNTRLIAMVTGIAAQCRFRTGVSIRQTKTPARYHIGQCGLSHIGAPMTSPPRCSR